MKLEYNNFQIILNKLKKRQNKFKRLFWTSAAAFVLINIIAIFHSYNFTHFDDSDIAKTQKPEKLNFIGKVNALLFGVNNPRPVNKTKPAGNYESVELQSNKKIEAWYLRTTNIGSNHVAKGTIIICHGYGGEKSSMLDKAEVFDSLGYDTFLIDFMGSGGSEGNTTTIGYEEAEQVRSAYAYLKNRSINNVYLFGTSMGAVAILKAMNDYNLRVSGLILECPFGTMYQTVAARFKNMNVPAFPMAGLLVFWGGVQNGFWAFGHNPVDYAKKITCPTLLLYGEQDKNVSREEIDDIYNNLVGPKILKTYKLAGHENYLNKYKSEWTQDLGGFLASK